MAANLQTIKARDDDVVMVDMNEVETGHMVVGKVPVSHDRGAQCPDVHGVAIISPRLATFWLISFREQRKTSGHEHLRNVDAKGD